LKLDHDAAGKNFRWHLLGQSAGQSIISVDILADPFPEALAAAEAEEPDDLDRILADPILQWRCKRLLDNGFNLPQARTLALDRTVDIHVVIERLVGRGCSPDVAFLIAS
jgi:hypothetical protein